MLLGCFYRDSVTRFLRFSFLFKCYWVVSKGTASQDFWDFHFLLKCNWVAVTVNKFRLFGIQFLKGNASCRCCQYFISGVVDIDTVVSKANMTRIIPCSKQKMSPFANLKMMSNKVPAITQWWIFQKSFQKQVPSKQWTVKNPEVTNSATVPFVYTVYAKTAIVCCTLIEVLRIRITLMRIRILLIVKWCVSTCDQLAYRPSRAPFWAITASNLCTCESESYFSLWCGSGSGPGTSYQNYADPQLILLKNTYIYKNLVNK